MSWLTNFASENLKHLRFSYSRLPVLNLNNSDITNWVICHTQVHTLIDSSFILACAPENSAADLLAERLVNHVDKGKLLRMYAASRPWDFVPQKLKVKLLKC